MVTRPTQLTAKSWSSFRLTASFTKWCVYSRIEVIHRFVSESVKRKPPGNRGPGQARTPTRPPRSGRCRAHPVPRTRVRGHHHRGDQRALRRPDRDRVPAVLLEASGILKALLAPSIAGDDQPQAVEERQDVASLFAEPDPHVLLAGFAGVTTAINQRTNDVYRVLESAAGSDPAAAELLREIRQQRRRRSRPHRTRACARARTQVGTTRTRCRGLDSRADVPGGLSPARR